MDEINNIIEKIVNDIREKKEKVIIPDIPERCKNCIDGDYIIEDISFTCDKYGENYCILYQDFIKEFIGKNSIDISIEKVEDSVKEKIIKYLKNFQKYILLGKGLTIIGSIGSGKTSILLLLIKECFKKRIPFYYYHSYKIFEEKEERIVKKRVLFIDDLGVEMKNEFNKSFFDYLIDYRYRFKLPTFITSNLSINKLKEEYPRGYDRLKIMNYLIYLQGGSKR
ncbi:MAG: hypothetical protein ACPLZ9_03835 [Candidatus Ratteibacteria bacterium]